MSMPLDQFADDDRLLATLQRLLTIDAPDLRPALDQASTLIAEALGADKSDIFLYEAESNSLVAMGTSDTPLGHRQHELGLDRMPLANGGPPVTVFQTGEPYLTGHADQDPEQPRGVIEDLGVRSQIDVALVVNGERRGVLAVVSAEPERFSTRDLRFLQAAAGWIGLVTHRAELFEARTRDTFERGRADAGDEVARLTARQRDVAICLAAGLSNEEIAERLCITVGTAANHIEHILRRLGLRRRTQIAVWAVERGLYRSGQERDDEHRERPRHAGG
jgi:two-component system OmpR family sensor kinase